MLFQVAYFTATFPYVMLTVLVARGVTLPGASKGIIYFISPDFKRLLEPEVRACDCVVVTTQLPSIAMMYRHWLSKEETG